MKNSVLVHIPCRITILGQPGEVVLSEGEEALPYQLSSEELAMARREAVCQGVPLDRVVFDRFGEWWASLPVTKDLLNKMANQEPSYQKIGCRITQVGNIIWVNVN
ncbi:hypothetical protein [Streptomyces eurythermus]